MADIISNSDADTASRVFKYAKENGLRYREVKNALSNLGEHNDLCNQIYKLYFPTDQPDTTSVPGEARPVQNKLFLKFPVKIPTITQKKRSTLDTLYPPQRKIKSSIRTNTLLEKEHPPFSIEQVSAAEVRWCRIKEFIIIPENTRLRILPIDCLAFDAACVYLKQLKPKRNQHWHLGRRCQWCVTVVLDGTVQFHFWHNNKLGKQVVPRNHSIEWFCEAHQNTLHYLEPIGDSASVAFVYSS